MATIGNTWIGYREDFKTRGPDGMQVAQIMEWLMLRNPMLEDAITLPCNRGATHITTIRAGLPGISYGRLYQGIKASKSGYVQVEDTTGWIEGRCEVDERQLMLSPNPAALRAAEAKGFLQAMSNEAAQGIIYNDIVTTPERFKGIAARYNSLANENVVDAGGRGSDNASIYIITWSEDATHLLYPQGTSVGIQRVDKGSQRVLDPNGDPYYVKEELFTQHLGVTVRDFRRNVRIANIDVSLAREGRVDLYALLRSAYYRLDVEVERSAEARMAVYLPRDLLEVLDAQSTEGTNVRLRPMEIEGKQVLTWRGHPLRRTDALLLTETAVL